MNKLDKRILKRSLWASVSRLIGVALGAGAGSLLHQLLGGGFSGWGMACGMAVVSFGLMLYAEYLKESG